MNQGQVYIGPRPGDLITTAEQAEALPVGSVVARSDHANVRFQKGGPLGEVDRLRVWWSLDTGSACATDDFLREVQRRRYEVESVPADLGETVAQFGWRFRDLAIRGAERVLGSPQAALNVMGKLKLEYEPSVGLRIANQFDRDRLPEGTVAYCGDPGDYANFMVARKEGGRWRPIFGGGSVNPMNAVSIVIDRLPDSDTPADWLVHQATEADRAKVHQFRVRAWDAGLVEKNNHTWCKEFERVMMRGGMSASTVLAPLLNGFQIGDVVSPEQAATLGLGVILSTPDDDLTGLAVFERTEQATNRAGTRRIGGWNRTGHYAQRMVIRTVAGDGRVGLGLRCLSQAWMDAAPLGTVIGSWSPNRRLAEPGQHYIKTQMPSAAVRTWTRLSYFDTPNEMPMTADQYESGAFSPGPRSGFGFYRFGPREESTS